MPTEKLDTGGRLLSMGRVKDAMNDVKAAVSLSDFAADKLTRSKGGMWCCPACGSGTRGTANSDGALSIAPDGRHWKCFSCNSGGDVFDLAGVLIGTDDKRRQLEYVAGWARIPLEGESASQAVSRPAERHEAEQPAPNLADGRSRAAEYRSKSQEAIEDPEALSYLSARGFSLEDARAAEIGYDPMKKALVIPWPGSSYYYELRYIHGDGCDRYRKPSVSDVGPQPLYNPEAPAKSEAYFIVEGPLDAIAVSLCGYEAVAVASNHLSSKNIAEITDAASRNRDAVAIVMLDNDERGREGTASIIDALTDANIPAIDANPDSDGLPNDAAEWHEKHPDVLRFYLKTVYEDALKEAAERRDERYRENLEALRVLDPADVARGIEAMRGFEEPTPTGIQELDRVLDGGLRTGLYALGAISSMGKTTLSVQVADHVAEGGRGVLFVTIEQSAREIVAKSLSRLVRTMHETGYNVMAPNELLSASRRARWSGPAKESFVDAFRHYTGRIAPRMRILEGTRQPSVDDIAGAIGLMAEHDGRTPAVFIDYLQLLAPSDERDTDKQAIDKNVMRLRQIARDMGAPIWVISSLNRSSYSQGVTLDAFKESGAIEYGCDVLLGLQPYGMREAVDKANESRLKRDTEKTMRHHKAGTSRNCELLVLKNRNGATPEDGIPLTFKPASSLYTEGVDVMGASAGDKGANVPVF